MSSSIKEYDVATNGISLHVTEQGGGPAVLFCHGFPDTSYTWRRQMNAVAAAGYRAVAPDMRGYGRSSAPTDANLYTPLQTAGDLVGLLDALKIHGAVIVGHDWGAPHAWNAAMMRPDRFNAVFCLSVPPVGFARTCRNHPELYFNLSAAFKGAKITQPSFFIWGKADGLRELYPLTIDQIRAGLPGLVGGLELDDVGHWVQHEAAELVSEQLIKFLRTHAA